MKLSEKKLKELKNKKTSIEDLDGRYFIEFKENKEKIETKIEADNVLRLLNENICSFKEIVDKFKSIKDEDDDPSLYKLLRNKEFFEELIQNNRLTQDDLRYLLNRIDNEYRYELRRLCENTSLIKYVLNELVLDKKLVDKFNVIAENNYRYKDHDIHSLFELIEYCRKSEIDQELLELNNLNEKAYLLNSFDLSIDQKLELTELIQNNEIAQNRLMQIVDNNLESNYDFEKLMNYLKKKERKNLINI